MTRAFPTRLIFPVTLAVLLWLPAAAFAQRAKVPVTPFDQLGPLLPTGTIVIVETTDGRKLKGRLNGLSTTGLEVDAGGAQTLAAKDVRRIVRLGPRPVGKLALIGLGFGGLVAVSTLGGERTDPILPSNETLAGMAVMAGGLLGAALGAAVGPSQTPVYQAPRAARITLAPYASPGRRGVTLSIAF